MIEYIKSQKETNDAILNNKFNADELERFSKSDFRWVKNKGRSYQTRTIKKGEIYQFEFGKNYMPEMQGTGNDKQQTGGKDSQSHG